MNRLIPDRTSNCQSTTTNLALHRYLNSRQSNTCDGFLILARLCLLDLLILFNLIFVIFLPLLLYSLLLIFLVLTSFDISLDDLGDFPPKRLKPEALAVDALVDRGVFDNGPVTLDGAVPHPDKKTNVKIYSQRDPGLNNSPVSISHLRDHVENHS